MIFDDNRIRLEITKDGEIEITCYPETSETESCYFDKRQTEEIFNELTKFYQRIEK